VQTAWEKPVVLLGIIVGLGVVPASASTIRDDVSDSEYQALGALSDFASVGTLVGSLYTGCGILIAPDWVLTAAHLLTFSTSETFTINGASYTSSSLYRDPAWNGYGTNGGDFALVHFNTPVTSVTPATLFTGTSELGMVGTYVGYGFTGTGLTGYKTLDGNKRAFQDIIDTDFNNPTNVYGSLFINPHNPSTGTAQPLEGCVAYGDSGGGVFVQVGSQYELTGVISFVASTNGPANSYYGNYSGFSRMSSGLPWIESIVPSVVPEPPASALAIGTSLLVLCFRRFKK